MAAIETDHRAKVANTVREPANVDGLARGIVQWLVSRQKNTGAICGDDGSESPSDHYAHSFAGLAFALLAEKEQSHDLWVNAERSIDYTLSIDAGARRKQEFNSLALLMLTSAIRDSKLAPERLRDNVESAIREPSFLYDGARLVSNNWLAMRAVCFLMRGGLVGDKNALQRGRALINQTLEWQLGDGIFIDFPARRRPAFEYATPLTYHAKMCAMLAAAVKLDDMVRDTALPALKRGLKALISVMSATGECLYYGRSCNSIFGYAAAWYAICTIDTEDSGDEWKHTAALLLNQISTRQETDGHLRLTPEKSDTLRSGWDIYYHNEVYNAYAAAMLLSAPAACSAQAPCRKQKSHCIHMADAGILAIQAPGFFASVSTRGQCVPDGSSLFCDMRYSGMQPLLVEVDGREQIPEPPLWWTGSATKGQAVSPVRIGYVPYIVLEGNEYCARVFRDVQLSGGDNWYGVFGKGDAASLSLPHRLTRVLRRIRGKVTGNGDLAFTPRKLPDLVILRSILVFPHKRALLFVDGYLGNLPRTAVWNGTNARISQSTDMVVSDVLNGSPLVSEYILPTSRGTANYISVERTESPAPMPGCVSAIACTPNGLDVLVEARGTSVSIRLGEICLCLNLQTGQIVEQVG